MGNGETTAVDAQCLERVAEAEQDHSALVAACADRLLSEGLRVVEAVTHAGLTLRLTGGIAVRYYALDRRFADRAHTDIDLVGLKRESGALVALLDSLGYLEDSAVSLATANGQLRFYRTHRQCAGTPLSAGGPVREGVSGLLRGTRASRWINWLSSMGNPLVRRISDKPAFAGEELVVVPSPFFPHKLAKGYSDPFCQVVKTVNGIPIKNLNHLVEVLRDAKTPFITVEFNNREGETMVFPRADMLAATDEILTDNGVRSQGSPDTLAIWNAKPLKTCRNC